MVFLLSSLFINTLAMRARIKYTAEYVKMSREIHMYSSRKQEKNCPKKRKVSDSPKQFAPRVFLITSRIFSFGVDLFYRTACSYFFIESIKPA